MVTEITHKPVLPGTTLQNASRVKKRDKVRSFANSLAESEETIETQATQQTRAMMMIDALFLNLDDKDEGNRKAYARAEVILDYLGNIQKGLMDGHINNKALDDLSKLSQRKVDGITDPKLLSILQEIETRAQVELAKLEMSRKKPF